jgi:hypothetical protein
MGVRLGLSHGGKTTERDKPSVLIYRLSVFKNGVLGGMRVPKSDVTVD